jgi:HK97 family phage major capsid protein
MRKGIELAPDITAIDIGTPADGGYFAPVEWDRTVTEKLKQLSPIRANAR